MQLYVIGLNITLSGTPNNIVPKRVPLLPTAPKLTSTPSVLPSSQSEGGSFPSSDSQDNAQKPFQKGSSFTASNRHSEVQKSQKDNQIMQRFTDQKSSNSFAKYKCDVMDSRMVPSERGKGAKKKKPKRIQLLTISNHVNMGRKPNNEADSLNNAPTKCVNGITTNTPCDKDSSNVINSSNNLANNVVHHRGNEVSTDGNRSLEIGCIKQMENNSRTKIAPVESNFSLKSADNSTDVIHHNVSHIETGKLEVVNNLNDGNLNLIGLDKSSRVPSGDNNVAEHRALEVPPFPYTFPGNHAFSDASKSQKTSIADAAPITPRRIPLECRKVQASSGRGNICKDINRSTLIVNFCRTESKDTISDMVNNNSKENCKNVLSENISNNNSFCEDVLENGEENASNNCFPDNISSNTFFSSSSNRVFPGNAIESSFTGTESSNCFINDGILLNKTSDDDLFLSKFDKKLSIDHDKEDDLMSVHIIAEVSFGKLRKQRFSLHILILVFVLDN